MEANAKPASNEAPTEQTFTPRHQMETDDNQKSSELTDIPIVSAKGTPAAGQVSETPGRYHIDNAAEIARLRKTWIKEQSEDAPLLAD